MIKLVLMIQITVTGYITEVLLNKDLEKLIKLSMITQRLFKILNQMEKNKERRFIGAASIEVFVIGRLIS